MIKLRSCDSQTGVWFHRQCPWSGRAAILPERRPALNHWIV